MDKTHISSGGVIYKVSENNQIKILLLHRKETDSWHLPKGTQNEGEDLIKTAMREVKEETGLDVDIEKYLGTLPSLKEDGAQKLTHYYLMKPIGRELDIFNHEEKYDKVEWLEIEKAKKLLSEFKEFEKEEEIVGVAERFIKEKFL